MHLATTLNRTVGRRLKLSIATFATLLCASMGLAMGTAASASAAGPDYLNAGQSVNYPTWGWGSTRVCAQNLSSRAGMADVTPHWSSPPGQHDEIYVNAYTTRCIDRWWGGVWVNVANVSHYRLGTYPLLKVWSS